jgi:UDPglucose 6-dehydrogenase
MGLWHLGCVTSACLSNLGINVVGLDSDEDIVKNLKNAIPPIFEPGLDELLKTGLTKNLSFTTDIKAAVEDADYLWVTYDTPVDDDDNADVSFVMENVIKTFPFFTKDVGVIVSSQLPARHTRLIKDIYYKDYVGFKPVFAYSPENLRLGKALNIFMNPDRIIIGADVEDRQVFEKLFIKISNSLEWMGIESAEMTKHAINAFLATSVVFANEVASICELVGADAKEVARGLKTEERIGPKAYVSPGGAISGGTLNRDIMFLTGMSKELNISSELLSGVKKSNDGHKFWPIIKLKNELGQLKNKKIGILGLTYKPGTNTLRRSLAIELCRKLKYEGADLNAYDPAVDKLTYEYGSFIELCDSAEKCFLNADAVILCTEWPEFKGCLNDDSVRSMRNKIVIDINGFFDETIGALTEYIKWIVFGRQRNEIKK